MVSSKTAEAARRGPLGAPASDVDAVAGVALGSPVRREDFYGRIDAGDRQ